VLAFAFLAATVGQPPVIPVGIEFALFVEQRQIGKARFSQRRLADGGKMLDIRLELATSVVLQKSQYDSRGRAVRKSVDQRVDGSKVRSVLVTFNDEDARITSEANGERTVQVVSFIEVAKKNNPAEFWFLRDKPTVGQIERSVVFSIEKLAWEQAETTYTGKVALPNSPRTMAHKTVLKVGDRTVTSYLDDNGNPLYVADSAGIRWERR
jgi:hypothetical protein